MKQFELYQGDCLEVLRTMSDNSVDSIVTDPPYGLSFMGKRWDYDVPSTEVWAECLRVLKPGGHLLAFAGTRTQHRMAVRIEDAGFEIRDMIAWVYGSGFPKSLDVSKAIDKATGAEREVVGFKANYHSEGRRAGTGENHHGKNDGSFSNPDAAAQITAPATDAARQWQGWGTALKPAHEPVGIYYKPATIAQIFGIVMADISSILFDYLCLKSPAHAKDVENSLNAIRARLQKEGALSVAESVRTSALENTETAVLAALSSMSQKHMATELDITKDGSALESASQSGKKANTLERTIQPGMVVDTSTWDIFMSAIMENTSESIASLWNNILDDVLSQANTFTTSTAIKKTIELKTLKSLLLASISQDTGNSRNFDPALEPITVARKPLIGTVADNILAHGTGALNIDGCRVAGAPWKAHSATGLGSVKFFSEGDTPVIEKQPHDAGRWPANLIHDGSEEVLAAFPDAKGQQGALTGNEPSSKTANTFGEFAGRAPAKPRADTGSAARFFYCAKASKRDRDEGLEGFELRKNDFHRATSGLNQSRPGREGRKPSEGAKNHHPTVKPTDLMAYLCRLVTPPGGVVLDPFMGSGSTGKAAMREGFRFIGIEREAEYLEIARARIANDNTQRPADAVA